MSQVNLNAVAKLAGVSISTVSRSLNEANTAVPISEKTRQKVADAARTLGYVPNAGARMLRTGRSRTVGVIGTADRFFSQFGGSGFVGEMLKSLIHASIDCGYHTSLLTGWEARKSVHQSMADLGMVDGLLVLNRDLSRETDFIDTIRNLKIPVVFGLEFPEGRETYVSSADDVQGGRLATEQLLKLGHRRIALVKKDFYDGIFGRRQSGWEEGLRKAGVEVSSEWVLDADDLDIERVRSLGMTAAVCCNEWIARQFREALVQAGLSVPDDFSLVDFSYESSEAEAEAEVAGVVQPLAEVTRAGLEMLVDRIEGRIPKKRHWLFPFKFRPGLSLRQLKK